MLKREHAAANLQTFRELCDGLGGFVDVLKGISKSEAKLRLDQRLIGKLTFELSSDSLQ